MVQEYILGAHSSKSAVLRVKLVEKILLLFLNQIMRERRGREGARQAKWL